MNEVVTAADAARAALDAADGGASAAVVTAVSPAAAVYRIIVRAAGAGVHVTGRMPDASLHSHALERATSLLNDRAAAPAGDGFVLDGAEWIVLGEVHHAPEHLVIVGAGHIAVPLATLARMLDFRVTVLDDREEFATTERFGNDVTVIRADFERDPFADVRLGDRTYLALVTRGHRWDFDCLQRVIAADVTPRYIGMIGSRRRVRAAFTALLDAGVSRATLATIRAPIGLELRAETPAEIALSIAAEMVAVRHGAEAGSISVRERVLERFLADA